MSMSLEAYWACPHCGTNYLISQQAWVMDDCCQAFFNSWIFQRLTETKAIIEELVTREMVEELINAHPKRL